MKTQVRAYQSGCGPIIQLIRDPYPGEPLVGKAIERRYRYEPGWSCVRALREFFSNPPEDVSVYG